MRVTKQRISSQTKPPWKGSQHNIQHPGATSETNFMPSSPNSGRMNGTRVNVHLILPKVKPFPDRWQRPEMMFATGHDPIPTYLKRFSLGTTNFCGCGKLESPLHFATSWPLTSSFHFTNPSKNSEILRKSPQKPIIKN
ncbi:hypothetical protein AVEN_175889-1 [Araneus ventricosus]|uniref:Uncharacterized protein n=1 Tax=Araneus ventricosus TaxID=182803 RepID=A0A4Y2EFT6_ARAVE|nr:hypothetical protein AVEN_175889-1 [Araneus ventricosus]